MNRRYRAGESVEDFCRACKTDRHHTIIVVDADAQPLRVSCDYCDSQHNFRGGPRIDVSPPRELPTASPGGPDKVRPTSPDRVRATSPAEPDRVRATSPDESDKARPTSMAVPPARATSPAEGEERTVFSVPTESASGDFEMLLRRILREESGLTPVAPAPKWRGGTLVLRPGTPGLQDKSWPIDTFFHKIVMLRNRLRTLEQQVNASELPDDVKIKLQGYVSGCYGSLTSFNVLFADEDDQFKGSGA
jgi:hypothetical protein